MSGAVAALVWCPFPDEASAAATAERLLDEGLIACANLLPAVRSLYRWRGQRGLTSKARSRTMSRIFEGLKVIDCGSFIAAPLAATLMGDFGADVIKIEPPGSGDPYRNVYRLPGMPKSDQEDD